MFKYYILKSLYKISNSKECNHKFDFDNTYILNIDNNYTEISCFSKMVLYASMHNSLTVR